MNAILYSLIDCVGGAIRMTFPIVVYVGCWCFCFWSMCRRIHATEPSKWFARIIFIIIVFRKPEKNRSAVIHQINSPSSALLHIIYSGFIYIFFFFSVFRLALIGSLRTQCTATFVIADKLVFVLNQPIFTRHCEFLRIGIYRFVLSMK